MAYSVTWNSTFEGTPAGGDSRREGATRFQELKQIIREIVSVDHQFGDTTVGNGVPTATDIDNGNSGYHSFVTLKDAVPANPVEGSTDTGQVRLYNDNKTLKFRDGAGAVKNIATDDSVDADIAAYHATLQGRVIAWARIDSSGSVLGKSSFISSITKVATGQYKLNFASSLGTNTYACLVTTEDTIAVGVTSGRLTTSVTVFTYLLGGTATDTKFDVVLLGV